MVRAAQTVTARPRRPARRWRWYLDRALRRTGYRDLVDRARFVYNRPDLELDYLIGFLEWAHTQDPTAGYDVTLASARHIRDHTRKKPS